MGELVGRACAPTCAITFVLGQAHTTGPLGRFNQIRPSWQWEKSGWRAGSLPVNPDLSVNGRGLQIYSLPMINITRDWYLVFKIWTLLSSCHFFLTRFFCFCFYTTMYQRYCSHLSPFIYIWDHVSLFPVLWDALLYSSPVVRAGLRSEKSVYGDSLYVRDATRFYSRLGF